MIKDFSPPNSWQRFLVLVVLFLLPHGVYYHFFTTPPGNDFPIYQPNALLRFLSYVQEGYLPLWSPILFGGMNSAFENSLSQSFSPITWLYFLFSDSFNGNLLQVLLHFKLLTIGLGGCFAFLFFHKISSCFSGALFGSLIFMFNFRMLDNLRYSTPVEILVLLPLLLLFIEKIIKREGSFSFYLYALLLGLMLLSGHPQHCLYNLMFLAAYFLFRIASSNETELSLFSYFLKQWKLISLFALVNLAGLFLASPLLLPFKLDILPVLYRRLATSFVWTDIHKMGLTSLVSNFGLPWFADVHSGFYSAISASLLLAFTFYGLRKKQHQGQDKKFLYFFLTYFLFALLYSTGSTAHVSTIIGYIIPPLKSSRAHGRIMGTGVLCLAALIVFTFKWIENRKEDPISFKKLGFYTIGVSFISIVSFCVTILTYSFYFDIFQINSLTLTQQKLALIAHLIPTYIFDLHTPVSISGELSMIYIQLVAFLIFMFLTLITFKFLFTPLYFKKAFIALLLLFLVEVHFYQRRGQWTLPDFPRILSSREFLSLDTYHNRLFRGIIEYEWPLREEIKEDLTMREIVPVTNTPKTIAQFLLQGKDPAAYLFGDIRQGKLFFPQHYIITSNLKKALEQNSKDLRNNCFIEASEAKRVSLKKQFGVSQKTKEWNYSLSQPQASFQILTYTPNRISFRLKTNQAGIINYLEVAQHGFHATIDGIPAELIHTYGTFKGVFVPPGLHTIKIWYQPKSFFYALLLCFGTMNILLTFMCFTRLQRYDLKKNKRILLVVLFCLSIGFILFQGQKKIYQMIEKPGILQYKPH